MRILKLFHCIIYLDSQHCKTILIDMTWKGSDSTDQGSDSIGFLHSSRVSNRVSNRENSIESSRKSA